MWGSASIRDTWWWPVVIPLRRCMSYWGGRINHLHVKDARQSILDGIVADHGNADEIWRRRAFCALGEGDIPLEAVFDAVRSSGYSGWLVVPEQDIFPEASDPSGWAAISSGSIATSFAPWAYSGGSVVPDALPLQGDVGTEPRGPQKGVETLALMEVISDAANAAVGTPAIQFTGVSKRYGSQTAVHPIDLEIQDGEFFCLLGPSGCGKSTTLSLIGGFAAPSSRRDPHQRRTRKHNGHPICERSTRSFSPTPCSRT